MSHLIKVNTVYHQIFVFSIFDSLDLTCFQNLQTKIFGLLFGSSKNEKVTLQSKKIHMRLNQSYCICSLVFELSPDCSLGGILSRILQM